VADAIFLTPLTLLAVPTFEFFSVEPSRFDTMPSQPIRQAWGKGEDAQ